MAGCNHTTAEPETEGAETYLLVIRLARSCRVTVGRLGTCCFPSGWYLYTGSARGGRLPSRVARHLRSEKRLRWHIDYLLAEPAARIVAVHVTHQAECVLNQALGGNVVQAGFGASDCRVGCGSHLRHFRRRPLVELPRYRVDSSAASS